MEIGNLETAEAHGEGAECRIKGFDGKDTDVFIHIKGCDSLESQKCTSRARRDATVKLSSKDLAKKGLSDDYYIDVEVGELVELTTGWRGLTDKGEPVPYSKERSERLFRSSPGVRSQLINFAYNRANFIKG